MSRVAIFMELKTLPLTVESIRPEAGFQGHLRLLGKSSSRDIGQAEQAQRLACAACQRIL